MFREIYVSPVESVVYLGCAWFGGVCTHWAFVFFCERLP